MRKKADESDVSGSGNLETVAQDFIDSCVIQRLDMKHGTTPEDFLQDLYKWALESVCLTLFNKRIGNNWFEQLN